jgi:hypothetical protein
MMARIRKAAEVKVDIEDTATTRRPSDVFFMEMRAKEEGLQEAAPTKIRRITKVDIETGDELIQKEEETTRGGEGGKKKRIRRITKVDVDTGDELVQKEEDVSVDGENAMTRIRRISKN